jgi:hypothetical protein
VELQPVGAIAWFTGNGRHAPAGTCAGACDVWFVGAAGACKPTPPPSTPGLLAAGSGKSYTWGAAAGGVSPSLLGCTMRRTVRNHGVC